MGHPVGKLVMGQLLVDAAQVAFGGARALIGSVDFLVNQFNAIGIKQGFFGAGVGTKDQGFKGVKHRDLRYDLSQVLALTLGKGLALRFLSSVNLGGNLLIPCQVVDASVFLVLFLNVVHKLNILKMNSAHVLFWTVFRKIAACRNVREQNRDHLFDFSNWNPGNPPLQAQKNDSMHGGKQGAGHHFHLLG